mmetsp:Transcript_8381/g.35024  ORF Transcript_8381/g.35024 Transcript_8381/m.35024 type:complete len:261 (+) Transcript_8381:10925-11707(+)
MDLEEVQFTFCSPGAIFLSSAPRRSRKSRRSSASRRSITSLYAVTRPSTSSRITRYFSRLLPSSAQTCGIWKYMRSKCFVSARHTRSSSSKCARSSARPLFALFSVSVSFSFSVSFRPTSPATHRASAARTEAGLVDLPRKDFSAFSFPVSGFESSVKKASPRTAAAMSSLSLVSFFSEVSNDASPSSTARTRWHASAAAGEGSAFPNLSASSASSTSGCSSASSSARRVGTTEASSRRARRIASKRAARGVKIAGFFWV